MSYTALYRKWRPDSFKDVKGQGAVVQTLKNQISANRIGHAYLFCGTRGTGKTSIAKIFARAVNCENPADGSPCNECAVCKGIIAGSSMNVVEIDAASNNGVDNIREIRDEVQYSPTEGKYRVYIIDEVHMLSTGAFNALLKTLEEPPSYVIFILATTEVHKIPVTVLSRCQRYDFKRITIETIVEHLKELTAAEAIETEEKALRFIAKSADGAMRDALSLLDQCMAFHIGEKLTYEHVLDVLGAVDNQVFSQLLDNVLKKNLAECMRTVEEIVMQGRDLPQFVVDFTWYLRNLLLIKTAEDAHELLDMSEENMKQMELESRMVDTDTLIRFIRIFSELSNQMKYAAQKRILLELSLIKLSRPEMESNMESVLQRLTSIEKQLESGTIMVSGDAAALVVPAGAAGPASDEEPKAEPKIVHLPREEYSDLKLVQDEWNRITAALGGSLRHIYKDAVIEAAGPGRIKLVFSEPGTYNMGSRATGLSQLGEYVAAAYQRQIEFSTRLKEGREEVSKYVTDEYIAEVIQQEIEIED